MPKFTSFYEAEASNIRFHCDVPDCVKHRHGISRYCLKHRNTHARTGHPLQRSQLFNSRHSLEREKVRTIVTNNANHPGILEAIRWLQQWINAAMRGEKGALALEDIRRLVDAGVTAEDILIEATSFYIYQQHNPHHFLSDEVLDISLSIAVLSLARPARRTRYNPDGTTTEVRQGIKAAPRKKVGRFIRSHLLDLFVNIQKLIEDNQASALTTKAAMRAPLTFPAVLMAIEDAGVPDA